MPLPHGMEEKVEVARLIPHKRSQHRTVEEIVEIVVAQIQQHSFEVIKGDSTGAGVETHRATSNPGAE